MNIDNLSDIVPKKILKLYKYLNFKKPGIFNNLPSKINIKSKSQVLEEIDDETLIKINNANLETRTIKLLACLLVSKVDGIYDNVVENKWQHQNNFNYKYLKDFDGYSNFIINSPSKLKNVRLKKGGYDKPIDTAIESCNNGNFQYTFNLFKLENKNILIYDCINTWYISFDNETNCEDIELSYSGFYFDYNIKTQTYYQITRINNDEYLCSVEFREYLINLKENTSDFSNETFDEFLLKIKRNNKKLLSDKSPFIIKKIIRKSQCEFEFLLENCDLLKLLENPKFEIKDVFIMYQGQYLNRWDTYPYTSSKISINYKPFFEGEVFLEKMCDNNFLNELYDKPVIIYKEHKFTFLDGTQLNFEYNDNTLTIKINNDIYEQSKIKTEYNIFKEQCNNPIQIVIGGIFDKTPNFKETFSKNNIISFTNGITHLTYPAFIYYLIPEDKLENVCSIVENEGYTIKVK